MYGDNGEIEGYFTTLAEARKVALDSKERYFNNDEFYISEMPWSDTEGEYVNIYDKNGGLLDAIEVV